MPPLVLIAAISSLSFPVAVVGFAIGAFIGARNRSADPNAPVALGVILGALCYMIAETLVLLLGALLLAGFIVAVIRYQSVVADTLKTFARYAGSLSAIRDFTKRGMRISGEFSQRQAFISQLPIDAKERERLRGKDRKRFSTAIDQLGLQNPYLPDSDSVGGMMGDTHVEDLFDMDEE